MDYHGTEQIGIITYIMSILDYQGVRLLEGFTVLCSFTISVMFILIH